MCNRLSLMTLRSVQKALSGNRRYLQFTRSISILADRCNAAPVFRQCYVSHDIAHNKTMGQNYSTSTAEPVIPIVTYDEVKDLPNHPEKTLIDVREPHELQETGIIPTATNIPLGEVGTAFSMSDKQFHTKYNRNKPDFTDEVIFYCKLGMRAQNAAITASKLGYTDARNYKGSWVDWAEHEGLPK